MTGRSLLFPPNPQEDHDATIVKVNKKNKVQTYEVQLELDGSFLTVPATSIKTKKKCRHGRARLSGCEARCARRRRRGRHEERVSDHRGGSACCRRGPGATRGSRVRSARVAAEARAISRSARVHRVAVQRGRSERAAAKGEGTTEEGFEERGWMGGGSWRVLSTSTTADA